MVLRNILLILSSSFLCGSSLSAQWHLLHPDVLPIREGHYVDTNCIRTYHANGFCTWTRPQCISGVSADGGATWSYETLSLPLPGFVSQSTSFYSSLEGYFLGAATPNPFSFEYRLYHTSDGGGSWIPHVSQVGYFFDWKFSSARDGVVFTRLGERGDELRYVWITHDSGRTLNPLCEKGGDLIAFSANGPYLRIQDSTMWLSADSGISFQEYPSPVRGAIRTAYLRDGHVWVLWTDAAKVKDRLSRSTDFGKSWETSSDTSMFDYSPISRMIFQNALEGIGQSSTGVWRTTDGGVTWVMTAAIINDPNSDRAGYSLVSDAVSGHILLMDGKWADDAWTPQKPDLRFRRSSDFGITWTTISSIRPWSVRDVKRWSALDLVAILVPSTESRYAWYEPLDSVCVLVSRDDGHSWKKKEMKPGVYQDHLTIFPGGRILVGTSYFSDNYGDTWTKSELPLGVHASAVPLFSSDGVGVTAAQADSLHLVVLKSEDYGKSWFSISNLELPYSGTGYAMRVIGLPTGALHLTFRYLLPSYRQDVYRAISLDQGKSWLPFQMITPSERTNHFREPKTRDGKHYLCSFDHFPAEDLYHSEDSGVTYSVGKLVHRFPPTVFKSFIGTGQDYGWISDSLCYMVCAEGYCLSHDGGKTWIPEEGFPLEGVKNLLYDSNQEQWFIGSYGLILQHRGPLGIVTSTDSPSPAPRDFSLPVTYPNPASSSFPVQVEFTLERDMPVGVFVYDLLGRRQRVLHEGRLLAGPQRFTLGTAGLPPGLYFVAVSTPEGVRVGKVVVGR